MTGIGFMVNLRSFSLAVTLPRIWMVSRFLLTADGNGRTAAGRIWSSRAQLGIEVEGQHRYRRG